ncbi:hypothetical protein A9Q84_01895 [Halobacteriovorax marinus]|uniref:MerC domain-containing protein n=1 Tax=Halobacteriovorax marinus TaxID=97084 RepID=A0A1Y5FHX9_9BACT|nr:hypothetical protein A9Q84_01895 [Halobacteriovorax marinus]
MDQVQQQRMDKVGIFLSLSCCIHCLATPILLVMAPSVSEYFESEWVHILLFLLVAPTALLSFLKTHRTNAHKRPLVLGSIGLLGLFVGLLIHFVGEHGASHGHSEIHELEVVINIISGLFLVSAHIYNFKDSTCKHC